MSQQVRFFTVAFLYLVAGSCVCAARKALALKAIHIGGLFPFNGLEPREMSMKGDLILPAVTMAMEDINKQAVLPGYRLELHANDTQCRADHASRVLFELINKKPTKTVIIGAGCSDVSGRIAEETKTWNLAMVSYGSTSSTLSDRTEYPYFFRTMPSDSACNKARIALLKRFNWKQVGLLVKSNIDHSTTAIHLQEDLKKANIHVEISETFVDDPAPQVKRLKTRDMRIIIGQFDETSARQVFCQAYHSGLYGARYVWLIPGWYESNWWNTNLKEEELTCTQEQMSEAVKGYIACDNLKMSLDEAVTISGMTPGQFATRYQKQTRKQLILTDAGFAYDAMWAVALALNRTQENLAKLNPTLSIENFTYSNPDIARYFKRSLEETNFSGITGPVQFTPEGDRMGFLKIEQLQGGKNSLVSLYLAQNDSIIDILDSTFVWQGSGPPSDRSKLVAKLMTISPVLYGVVCTITVLCILLAACFLGFNIKLRHYRYIKMSSPRLNDTIVIGCITMYISVFLFGLDGNLVSASQYSAICQARIWLASLGFTTAFGAMFAKIWRVYVIFTNAKLRKKVIQDHRLFLFVFALLLVDVFTLSVWTGMDSLTRKLQNGTIEHGTEFDTLPQWEYCDCQYKSIWFGVLFATKGLLLLFGVFLAWETRHVKIPALNDSRYVGMSVYNVVILSVVGVPATLMIEHAQNATFAITAGFVVFCTTVTLCLVFVPKFIAVKRNPSVLNTSGATSTSASQTSGESSTSQDKGIGGPKFIALAAENSNLKGLVAEKEEQISQLEARLKRHGVPLENLRRVSMGTKRPATVSGSSPTFHINEQRDRDADGSIHIEVPDSEDISNPESTEEKSRHPSSVRQSYSESSSPKLDSGVLLGHDLTKAHIPKKYSLPPRARKNVPQIEVRARAHSTDNEVQEAYENPVATMETREEVNNPELPRKKTSLNDQMGSPFYMEPQAKPLPSPRSRYSKRKKESRTAVYDGSADVNENSLPTVKGESKRKGSIVLQTKSQTGETCFQVKTSTELRETESFEEINI